MLFGVGLALVVVPVNSPLETIATERLLLVHLLQNVMLSDWAPPLLILGLTPAMRAVARAVGGRPFAALTRPVVSLPVWLVGWYAIHWGVFYDFALRHPMALNVEHLILVGIGLLFWWPVLADAPRRLADSGEDRLPRRGLRRERVPRARLHVLDEPGLRLLRAGAAALGPLAARTRTSAGS